MPIIGEYGRARKEEGRDGFDDRRESGGNRSCSNENGNGFGAISGQHLRIYQAQWVNAEMSVLKWICKFHEGEA